MALASCTTGVGDLIGAMLAVASTRLEARALIELPNLRASLQQEGHVRHRLSQRVDSLRDALRMASEDQDAAKADAADATVELAAATAARDRLATEVDSARRSGSLWRTVAIASLLALGAAIAGLMPTVIRGRRRSVHVPDTPGEPLEPATRH